MKVKIRELMNAQPALQELVGKEMGARVAFRLARIVSEVNRELAHADAVKRKLFDELGNDNEEGHREIPERNARAFEKQLQELVDTEIEFGFDRIKIGTLPDLTLGSAMALGWLVDDEEGDDDS